MKIAKKKEKRINNCALPITEMLFPCCKVTELC